MQSYVHLQSWSLRNTIADIITLAQPTTGSSNEPTVKSGSPEQFSDFFLHFQYAIKYALEAKTAECMVCDLSFLEG